MTEFACVMLCVAAIYLACSAADAVKKRQDDVGFLMGVVVAALLFTSHWLAWGGGR